MSYQEVSTELSGMEPRTKTLARLMNRFGRRLPVDEQVVALDVGTSKIVVLVAHANARGEMVIEGVGTAPSKGLKAGMVVNIEETVGSLQAAVTEAENNADCTIRSVNVGIASSHIRSMNSSGAIPVREGEITAATIDRVLDAASAVKLNDDKRILHVLPQEYVIDDQYGIRNPIGMSGVNLNARVHLVMVGQGAWHNLVRCVQECGLKVDQVRLEQVASGDAVLMPDEKELGVCLVDIGGGTSDIAVYFNGGIYHTSSLPVAGDNVNRDIAVALSTRIKDAEQIKRQYGCAVHEPGDEDQPIAVPGLGGRPEAQVQSSVLVDIIRPRYTELFQLINQELRHSGYYDSIEGAGLVLTGGGSMIRRLDVLAAEVFGRPVRIGGARSELLQGNRFVDPLYATATGLLACSAEGMQQVQATAPTQDSWLRRIQEWI